VNPHARVDTMLRQSVAQGRRILAEPEGWPLLETVGFTVPRHLVVERLDEMRLDVPWAAPGSRVVVKVVSESLLHRSDVGGVKVVEASPEAVRGAMADMTARLARPDLRFVVCEYVDYLRDIASEWIAGIRWTEDFGPVVTLGIGGIYTELLNTHFVAGDAVALFSSDVVDDDAIRARIERLPLARIVLGRERGQAARARMDDLVDVVRRLQALAAWMPVPLLELEINPLAVASGGLVPLDVLARLEAPEARPPMPAPRPIGKLHHLLAPARVAIAGVSESMNPGRIILENLRREGFPMDQVVVVKPGVDEIAGCRAVPDVLAIDGTVDLLVAAIGAPQVPALVGAAAAHNKAQSIIVIPGGLEEKAGTAGMIAPMYEALAASRATPSRGPLVNGGNCLGVRSVPGRIDTLFIPGHKLPPVEGPASPVAFISQSGAFAIAKSGKLAGVKPTYLITVGNQMDLTVADYLEYLERDDTLRVFAVYVEGFRPLDGQRLLKVARRLRASGRHLVLYRAGRTAEGAAASASHTASIAGDYVVTRELAEEAGIVLATSLDEFEDLVMMFTALQGLAPGGTRLGAVSNAGFECVAVADSLGGLTLAALDAGTVSRLEALLARARIGTLVDIHNPLDLTPMANDEVFAEAVRIVLEAPGVDVGLVGCVPLTGALQTLVPAGHHREDLEAPDSIVSRLRALRAAVKRPWVAVVDGGPLYDAMVDRLRAAGVPTFRTADRALRVFNRWVEAVGVAATSGAASPATSATDRL